MDIEKLVDGLKEKAEENFKTFGSVAPMAFFVKDESLAIMPVNMIQLLTKDKEKFYDLVRSMVKSIGIDVVILITEVFFVIDKGGVFEQPSKSKNPTLLKRSVGI